MNNAPLKNYGFTYEHEGKSFAFHVVAASIAEAQARVRAMTEAQLVGEMEACEDCASAGGARAVQREKQLV